MVLKSKRPRLINSQLHQTLTDV